MTADRSTLTALITGGAGFVATNVADRLLRDGWRVRLFDNLARDGVVRNLEWLASAHPVRDRIEFVRGDVRDAAAVRRAVVGVSRVFHFAAQVAVTTSLSDPTLDFETNAGGTLNLLEALRALEDPPTLLFTSTNKVYGHLEDLTLRPCGQRYVPANPNVAERGIGEDRPLDFHSPYGCSKGAAEQYVLDYARTFGLPATVFRMSCIYGPHQFGTEDQGWIAHFLLQALRGQPLTVYGSGLQVRDVLFVDDLVEAMLQAHTHIDRVRGHAYNIGGGRRRAISLLELIALIDRILGHPAVYALESWRPADQRYYVSDTTKFRAATGWRPQVSVQDGIGRLLAWLVESGTSSLPAWTPDRVAS